MGHTLRQRSQRVRRLTIPDGEAAAQAAGLKLEPIETAAAAAGRTRAL